MEAAAGGASVLSLAEGTGSYGWVVLCIPWFMGVFNERALCCSRVQGCKCVVKARMRVVTVVIPETPSSGSRCCGAAKELPPVQTAMNIGAVHMRRKH